MVKKGLLLVCTLSCIGLIVLVSIALIGKWTNYDIWILTLGFLLIVSKMLGMYRDITRR